MRPPVAVPPRRPWTRRAALWGVALALLAHVGAGSLPAELTPVAASTSAVSLVDDRNGTALFSSTGLHPGRVETACVALRVTGSAQSFGDVGLSAEVTQADLAPYLLVTVERGALGDPASCASFAGQPVWSGTLAQLPGTTAAGIPTGWRPDVEDRMVYRFTITVLDDPDAQGLGAAASFVWALEVEPAPEPIPPVPVPDPVPGPQPAPVPEAPEVVAAPEPVPAPRTTAAPSPSSTPSATPTETPTATPTATVTVSPGPDLPPTEPAAPSETPAPAPTPPATDTTGAAPRGGDVVQAPPLEAEPSTVAQVAAAVGETALAVANDAQFPLTLVAVVVGFLFLQGRLDQRDPKLALARVRQDLDEFRDFPELPRTAT